MKIKLIKNEELVLQNKEESVGNKLSKEEINSKYEKGEVRIITEQARYPLSTILSMVESDAYVLNPEFQRRHRWDVSRKSKLIESFIMNVPIPPIFLYEVEYSVYQVMDGLQRLTAISQFYKDEFELQGLNEWSELNGYKYSTLPEKVRKGIDRRYISSIILLQETAKTKIEENRLKQLVFERINSGGVKLTSQEIRNALYPGILNSACINMARDEYFCKLWNIPEADEDERELKNTRQEVIENILYKDMSDVELCLRFIAYRQIEKWQGFHNTMEKFLDDFLKKGNASYNEEVVANLTNVFTRTTKLAFDIYGEKAFWLHRKREDTWFHYERSTKILYDPIMQTLSNLLDKAEALVAKKVDIVRETPDFHKDNFETFKGRDTNRKKVQQRIQLLHDFFNGFLDENNV